jgi:hypothetical protein
MLLLMLQKRNSVLFYKYYFGCVVSITNFIILQQEVRIKNLMSKTHPIHGSRNAEKSMRALFVCQRNYLHMHC